MKYLLAIAALFCLASTAQDLDFSEELELSSETNSTHYLKPGESILVGDQRIACTGSGGGASVTRCVSRAPYTGELCCQVACYYPKVARCSPPGHPSICRSARCQCVTQ